MSEQHLRFVVDWEAVDESVRAPEIRATIARLEIWVGDQCVTLVEDPITTVARRSVIVSLYPLAEWIAFNWWLLSSDGRRETRNGRVDRRNMRSAGDGFLWPDLSFIGSDRSVRLTWNASPDHLAQGIRYFKTGNARLDKGEVLEALGGIVGSVISRLYEADIQNTPLHEEWVRLGKLGHEESEFCEASARLGLDPFSGGIDLAEDVDFVFRELDPG